LIIFSALGTLRTSAILQLSGYAGNWSVVMRTTEGANYRNHYRDSELTKRAYAIEWLKRQALEAAKSEERNGGKSASGKEKSPFALTKP
jgi:hypothetical protein